MECLGGYTYVVMISVILSGGVKMRVEHGMLREVYIFCHDFCHIFRWYEMRDEHGMVYISGHDFCHTFRWYGNEGRAWKV